MDILDFFWTFYLNHLSPLWGYFFEHINILESCNQPGIDNKSSNFIPEMVSCLEIKIQCFFLQKISEVRKAYTVKCPKINVM